MSTPTKKIALRVKEAAALLSISERTAYDLIYKGEIPSLRIGRAIRVPVEALNTYIKEQTSVGSKAA